MVSYIFILTFHWININGCWGIKNGMQSSLAASIQSVRGLSINNPRCDIDGQYAIVSVKKCKSFQRKWTICQGQSWDATAIRRFKWLQRNLIKNLPLSLRSFPAWRKFSLCFRFQFLFFLSFFSRWHFFGLCQDVVVIRKLRISVLALVRKLSISFIKISLNVVTHTHRHTHTHTSWHPHKRKARNEWRKIM